MPQAGAKKILQGSKNIQVSQKTARETQKMEGTKKYLGTHKNVFKVAGRWDNQTSRVTKGSPKSPELVHYMFQGTKNAQGSQIPPAQGKMNCTLGIDKNAFKTTKSPTRTIKHPGAQ